MTKKVKQYIEDENLMTEDEYYELIEIEKSVGLDEAAACWDAWKCDKYLLGKEFRK